jgi:hypothetical protein
MKPFSLPREDVLKPRSTIKDLNQTTRFGHVGIHHQRILPPGLQAISDRHAKEATSVESRDNCMIGHRIWRQRRGHRIGRQNLCGGRFALPV